MDIQLKNLIKSLSEINFKDLIVYYCKTRFNADNVRIIDGPYDGGNDLEIIKGDVDIKRNIQVTINKSYEHKLEADLCKISKLATENNQLDFFISQELSKTKRESLETNAILNSSRELRSLLQRDGIPMELICDYKIYPIADNPTPQLSADRLEYTLSSGMTFTRQWSVNDIQRLYSDIKVFKNEYNAAELGFKTRNIAEEFISGASKMWYVFMSSKDKLVMQFLADIIKCLTKRNIMDESGIYTLSESEIIDLALNSGFDDLAGTMISFQNSVQIFEGDSKPIRETSYCIDVVPKKRYINPMINGIRSTGVSQAIRNIIKEFTDYSAPRYCWFDFDVPKSLFF